MTRTLHAARLHLVTWPGTFIFPWAILALIFGFNMAVLVITGAEGTDGTEKSSLAAIYFIVYVTYLMAMTQLLSFALGLSVSRRTYYAATSLVAVAQSLGYGVVLYLLKVVEDATHGWGLSMVFFGHPSMPHGNALLLVLIYTVPFLLMAFAGMVSGLVHARWGRHGVLTMITAVIVVAGTAAVLLIARGQWVAVFEWIEGQSPASFFAGWALVPTVAFAAAGFLIIRRATP